MGRDMRRIYMRGSSNWTWWCRVATSSLGRHPSSRQRAARRTQSAT